MNCHVLSRTTRIGSEVMMLMRVPRAVVHASVQVKTESFFKRFVSGLAMSANLRMKGLWNPRTPKVLCTALTSLSCLGHSVIPAILDGLIVTCPWPNCTPRKLISVHSNLHLLDLRK